MEIATKTMITLLLVGVIFIGGGIWLQIFLSRRKSKWFGLILPGICFAYSLLMVLNVAVFSSLGTVNGNEILGNISAVLTVFIMSNIPTFILMGIYFAVREKFKRKKELDRMNVQDLD